MIRSLGLSRPHRRSPKAGRGDDEILFSFRAPEVRKEDPAPEFPSWAGSWTFILHWEVKNLSLVLSTLQVGPERR
jgi:hypothetical protein